MASRGPVSVRAHQVTTRLFPASAMKTDPPCTTTSAGKESSAIDRPIVARGAGSSGLTASSCASPGTQTQDASLGVLHELV